MRQECKVEGQGSPEKKVEQHKHRTPVTGGDQVYDGAVQPFGCNRSCATKSKQQTVLCVHISIKFQKKNRDQNSKTEFKLNQFIWHPPI